MARGLPPECSGNASFELYHAIEASNSTASLALVANMQSISAINGVIFFTDFFIINSSQMNFNGYLFSIITSREKRH